MRFPRPYWWWRCSRPSTTRRDLADKLAGYFQVPSVQHYLVIDGDEQEIIWHRRAASGAVEPPVIVREGSLRLDPPGIEIAVADVFAGRA